MDDRMNIQWYPGHMTKTRRNMEADLKLVDAVCEIVDARIPFSSRNPDIDAICGQKPRMMILNRIDLADPAADGRLAELLAGAGHDRCAHGLQEPPRHRPLRACRPLACWRRSCSAMRTRDRPAAR